MASLLQNAVNATTTKAGSRLSRAMSNYPGSGINSRPVSKVGAKPPVLSMPSPNKGRGGPTPISMPKPSMPSNQAINSASEASEVLMGLGSGIAAGAFTGAIFNNKDGTAGGMAGGAFRGAIAGGVVGGIAGGGIPALAKHGTANKAFMDSAGSWSTNLSKMSNAMHTSEGRTAMYASGGALGGFALGGSGTDKRRGFNKNRGSKISSNGKGY